MRTTETILGMLRDRGKRGLPVERMYRLLLNRELYLQAYGKIYRNKGAMTPGITGETVDGMSLKRIDEIIDDVRRETYRWTPVRRVQIPKKSGGRRPLGVTEWKDKLLQEVIRMLLDAYFDPQFSDASHGFRSKRGCHTALAEIARWDGTVWFVEGDIKGCFENIDHDRLVAILAESILDNRFLRLIRNGLRAGYMEDWKYGETPSGTPQGGVLSPLLSNVYLDRLDKFVEQTLIPEYTKGIRRVIDPRYSRVRHQRQQARRKGDKKLASELTRQMRRMPTSILDDPGFRRLKYVRYADDFICGFMGPKEEAEEIKRRLREFLADELGLELSEEKTLITHAKDERARFLGYEIGTMQSSSKLDVHGRRSVNGRVWLRVPQDVIDAKIEKYLREGKPSHLPTRQNDSDFSIVRQYQAEFQGVAQYYKLAHNVYHLYRLKWAMEQSLTATLAGKHRSTRAKMYRKYQTDYRHPNGKTYKVLEVRVKREGKKDLVARWGGIELKRDRNAIINDTPYYFYYNGRTELLERLLAETCEICGSQVQTQVHHVRALKDLRRKGRSKCPKWMEVMTARRRKTMVVCKDCHKDIHAGRDPYRKLGQQKTLED